MIRFAREAKEKLHCGFKQHGMRDGMQYLVEVLHGGAGLAKLHVVEKLILKEFKQEFIEVENRNVIEQLLRLNRVYTLIE